MLQESPCVLNSGDAGICCPRFVDQNADTEGIVNRPAPPTDIKTPEISDAQIDEAISMSNAEQEENRVKEQDIISISEPVPSNSPESLHALLFPTSDAASAASEKAKVALGTTKEIAKTFNLTKNEVEFGLGLIDLNRTTLADSCSPQPPCTPTKYRSMDGSCNNLQNRDWGKMATPYKRIIPPDYNDGVGEPRSLGKDGSPLPLPRVLTTSVFERGQAAYTQFTTMIMQWGQFISHDMVHTPQSGASCCNKDKMKPVSELSDKCMPIEIPATDPVMAPLGVECMSFVRSTPAIRRNCKFGPREQMNQISGFLDASNVYGTDDKMASNLRTFSGGLLKTTAKAGDDLLPNVKGCEKARNGAHACFAAGDVRVNEHLDLVVIHTLWMRQHNKVAAELQELNPSWSDEIVYQEARRIVAAQLQHITYNEYLPVVLGRDFVTKFGMAEGSTREYLPAVDPSINNAFATAAFRYGHTLIPDNLLGFDAEGKPDRRLPLSPFQFSPFLLNEPKTFSALLRGLTLQRSEKNDRIFTHEVMNKMFAQNGTHGQDLPAFNIQRGRDHGLPPYNVWRKICQMRKARTFTDFSDVMPAQSVARLQSVYADVEDVDLYVGGILEQPVPGSLLGPTFQCIVGDQFARLKLGDRYFYEFEGHPHSFSKPQLQQIRKTSLARVICDNAEDIHETQPLACVRPGQLNNRVSCSDETRIPRISLLPWQEEATV